MPLKLIFSKPISQIDKLIMDLSKTLVRELGESLLLVETHEGSDGSNVRILVREKSDSVVEKIFNAIEEVERRNNKPGEIIPDIVTPDEL